MITTAIAFLLCIMDLHHLTRALIKRRIVEMQSTGAKYDK